jgi:hypothetical protein
LPHPPVVLPRFFKSARSTRRERKKIAISFLQSFFLCGYFAKEKSVSTNLDSQKNINLYFVTSF